MNPQSFSRERWVCGLEQVLKGACSQREDRNVLCTLPGTHGKQIKVDYIKK